ncbi:MAG: Immunity protein 51 [Bacteroidota bacterium]|jgi:hypothetical protein
MVAEITDWKKWHAENGETFDETYHFLYSFAFYDVETEDSIYDWFEEKGYQGGGPTWAGVIFGLVMQHEPRNIKNIDLDDEGDGLVVSSNNFELLQRVLQWTTDTKYNEDLRLKAIEIAEKHDQME